MKVYKRYHYVEKIQQKIDEAINKVMLMHVAKEFDYHAYAEGISTTDLVNMVFNFVSIYTGENMYPYQEQFSKRIIRSILENDGQELTALFARQMGKTFTVSRTVGGCMIILPKLANMPMFVHDKRLQMFKDGLWVGIFAPSLRQAQNTYGRLRDALQCETAVAILSDPDFNYAFSTSNGQTVALTNGSFCTAVSASDGANIEGDSYKLIICEECQDISTFKIRKSIHPMGAAYNSTIVKIGTATTFKGDFYEAIQRNKLDFEKGKIKIRNHFEYNCLVGMKYNPKYGSYVSKEKYRLGENSDEFRMSYMLEWILSTGMFIDPDFLERNNGVVEWQRRPFVHDKDCILGVDLAKKDDRTVLTVVSVDWNAPVIKESNKSNVDLDVKDYIAYETRLEDWRELDGTDYDTQYYEILDYIRNFRIKKIMIDATKEAGMCDRLQANLPDIEVIACIFSSGFKSEMYKHLDSEIKTGRAKFPRSPEVIKTREYMNFLKQMGDLQKEYRGQLLSVHHPPTRGAHDDYPDSWALAVFGAREETDSVGGETINNNPLYQNSFRKSQYQSRNRITGKRR